MLGEGASICQSSLVVDETVEAALTVVTKWLDGLVEVVVVAVVCVVVIFCGCSAGRCRSSLAPRSCVIAVGTVRAGTRHCVYLVCEAARISGH